MVLILLDGPEWAMHLDLILEKEIVMTDTAKGRIFLAKGDGDTVLIASNVSPYFCFEAASSDEAIALAQRALAFAAETRTLPQRPNHISVSSPAWVVDNTLRMAV